MGTQNRLVVAWGWGKGLTRKTENNVLGLNYDGGIHLSEFIEQYTERR